MSVTPPNGLGRSVASVRRRVRGLRKTVANDSGRSAQKRFLIGFAFAEIMRAARLPWNCELGANCLSKSMWPCCPSAVLLRTRPAQGRRSPRGHGGTGGPGRSDGRAMLDLAGPACRDESDGGPPGLLARAAARREASRGLTGGTRTPDLLLRRQLLYPVELRSAGLDSMRLPGRAAAGAPRMVYRNDMTIFLILLCRDFFQINVS